jgi:hypothetical protein
MQNRRNSPPAEDFCKIHSLNDNRGSQGQCTKRTEEIHIPRMHNARRRAGHRRPAQRAGSQAAFPKASPQMAAGPGPPASRAPDLSIPHPRPPPPGLGGKGAPELRGDGRTGSAPPHSPSSRRVMRLSTFSSPSAILSAPDSPSRSREQGLLGGGGCGDGSAFSHLQVTRRFDPGSNSPLFFFPGPPPTPSPPSRDSARTLGGTHNK